jgi:predicted PurR-regulated permease PerM
VGVAWHPTSVDLRSHARTTGSALKHWLVAQTYDALCVAALWLAGLLILHVPWAPLWAGLAFFLQYVPHFGPLLSLAGPCLAAAFSGGWKRMLYVLILYALIAGADGFLLQPMFMKRRARIPVWASILTPLVLGFLLNFWGVLLSGPLLAIIFAYRSRAQHPDQQLPSLPDRPSLTLPN